MTRHIPVLLNETIDQLALGPGKNVVDCTLGDAGHSTAILSATKPNGKLLGIDADPEAILRAKHFLHDHLDRITLVRSNFVHLGEIVKEETYGPIHGILMDLGWSSPQFEERGRGFSFQKDEPLDMRFEGSHGGQTAAEIIAQASVDELTDIFADYGEERFARDIAKEIEHARKESPIKTTNELTEVVLRAYRKKLRTDKDVPWVGGLHPATKVFQALRIAVNRELDVLKEVLPQAIETLAAGGRLAVITFHSLEDRIVKHYFKSIDGKGARIITKKPIIPSDAEGEENPRARSAKLRVIEKL